VLAIFDEIVSSFKFANEISNWQKYSSDKYGFEFRYPSIFRLENPDQESVGSKIILGYLKIKNSGGIVGIVIKQEKLDPKNIKGLYGNYSESAKSITVNGRQSYMYAEGDAGCGGYVAQIPNGNNIIELSFSDCYFENDTVNDNSAEVYRERILSSFKFTEK